MKYLFRHYDRIFTLFLEHCILSFFSLLIALIISVLLSFLCLKNKKIKTVILKILEFIYTIPGLALLSFLVPFFDLGFKSALIAMVLYSQMSLVESILTGLEEINDDIIDAAYGMGMSKFQVIFKIKIPLAFPVIMGGIRIAAVTIISLASLAAFVNGGGLGEIVLEGIRMDNGSKIIAGTIGLCILIIFTDLLLRAIKNIKVFSYK